ncbi:class I SAM-dependent RNA methyltransferase [bacterium]|nr:class I SAM-dependent RNA methyltransferase [bacterium]
MLYYQKNSEFFAQVAGGLETMAAEELQELGARDVRTSTRGITFRAELEDLYRINYRARLVTRILAPLLKFPCRTPEELYLGAKKVDWTRVFRMDQTFAVFANVHRSQIDHGHFASLKVKDCVADMFRKRYKGRRPNVDADDPDLWIGVHILEDKATISIDCSGGSLHRRGYRQDAVEAPMMETLAAAMVDFAAWDGRRRVYDPMCGSGTLLAESWLKAGHIPAGTLRKKWGFMMLPDFDRRVWFKVKTQEDKKIKVVREGLIRGSDLDPAAVRMTRRNVARIPGGDELRVRTSDFRDLDGLEDALIICNPPYGIRLNADEDMAAFMKDFGDFLKQKCKGSDAIIYLGDAELVKHVGLKAAWKKPLRNGGLDGRLVKYELY